MLDLSEYVWKTVRLVDYNGKEWIGYVTDYEFADENYEEKECIGLRVDEKYLGFYIDEIKSIEEIN